MVVGIIGLGLMGASFAKTLKRAGNIAVFGTDSSAEVMKKARLSSVIDEELTTENAGKVDLLVAALYPRNFASAVEPFLPHMKAGAAVVDFCGIKRPVISAMRKMAEEYPGIYFIGGHPMAGREYSGIGHAVSTLFDKASMILVPVKDDIKRLAEMKAFFLSLGFSEVVVTKADYHDTMIAYTSQLCHVVSNAFIKNASAASHAGYSAGSYRDLTRVARMNSRMWAELMTDNRDKLLIELDELMENLSRYREALDRGDEAALQTLLEEGNERKIDIDAGKYR